MTEEEVQAIEEQFAKLYASDPDLQQAIDSPTNLNVLQKYQILVQYRVGDSQDQYLSENETTEIFEHEGKQYRKVQIEGQDGDHLMDAEQNIYTLDFVKIGKAGESDDDDD